MRKLYKMRKKIAKKVTPSVINRVILPLLVFSIAVRLRCSTITIPVWSMHCLKPLLVKMFVLNRLKWGNSHQFMLFPGYKSMLGG